MSVSVTSGSSPYRDGQFAQEDLAQATSTSELAIALTTPLTVISGGTSTGFGQNDYLLSTASAVEGQDKCIVFSGTGEAYVHFTGTATGSLVFTNTDDIAHVAYRNAKWRIVSTTATFATAT